MKSISFGKFINLQKCITSNGTFTILALDHRNNLRNAINPQNPEQVTDEILINFKLAVTKSLSPFASAVLLDPEVGAFQVIANNVLAHSSGLVVALEATGYKGSSIARESYLLHGWSVEKAKMMGANAAKLLVYYHPKSLTKAKTEDLVGQIEEECKKFDLPFILEILTYSINPDMKKLEGEERKQVVIEAAQRLSVIGGDLLKVEFPLDITKSPDEYSWAEACDELTQSCQLPWVLLSASVDFETYIKQVMVACQNGASGIAAGRAVWNEAVNLEFSQRNVFLTTEAVNRIQQLSSIVDDHALPFSSVYFCQNLPQNTYLEYLES